MSELQRAIEAVAAFTGRPWTAADVADEAPSPLVDQAIATILNAVVSGAWKDMMRDRDRLQNTLSSLISVCQYQRMPGYQMHPMLEAQVDGAQTILNGMSAPGGSMGCVGDVKPGA